MSSVSYSCSWCASLYRRVSRRDAESGRARCHGGKEDSKDKMRSCYTEGANAPKSYATASGILCKQELPFLKTACPRQRLIDSSCEYTTLTAQSNATAFGRSLGRCQLAAKLQRGREAHPQYQTPPLGERVGSMSVDPQSTAPNPTNSAVEYPYQTHTRASSAKGGVKNCGVRRVLDNTRFIRSARGKS